jgi:competence protein ComEC
MGKIRKGPVIFWSIFIAAAIFRVSQTFGIKPPDIGPCVKQNIVGSGIVSTEPERKESGQVLVVSVNSLSVASSSVTCKTDFLLRMKTKPYPRFKFGDEVDFAGKLLKPLNFSNTADPGRSFDYEGYLAKSDIFYEMKSAEVSLYDDIIEHDAIDTSLDKFVPSKRPNGTFLNSVTDHLSSILFSIKRRFVSNLEKTLGEPHAALASGLVVGEKAALGNDLLNDFRTVGLIHIVVLSGYNITIVGDAMRRMLIFLPRLWGISIGGIGIALFGILVGGGATVIRSCFMAGIALSANIIRRDYNVTRALIFAGLIMLIQSPMILLHDPSFQLSFLATMGLILLASPIEKRLKFIPDRFGIRGIVAATVATQIFVSPYILYMMGNLSIIGMVVNILVLPFIPVTMLFVFLIGAIGMVSISVAHIFAWVTHLLLSYELFMVENFAKLPFASVHLPAFSKWWVVGFYGVFIIIYCSQRYFSRR